MSCSSNPGRAPPVRVDGRKLTISGTSLFFKGVAWSPYNLSYSPNLGHRPDYVGFAALDAKLMQAASINVVRTYEAIGDVSVLDELWSHGIGVVMTIFLDAGYGHSVATALATVCTLKQHPAVLMWAVTNEPNYYSVSSTYMSDISTVVAAIKAEDSTRPVAVVWGEVASASVVNALPEVDVWGFNIYRGTSFTDLWTVWPSVSSKPFFIAEYGTDSYTGSADTFSRQASEVAMMATEVASQAVATGDGPCIGGVLFSFADEWWKYSSGAAEQHNTIPSWTAGGGYNDLAIQEEHLLLTTYYLLLTTYCRWRIQ